MSKDNFQVNFKVVPHMSQRYNSVGDYVTDENGMTTVLVSSMGDWRYEFLIQYHEMTEIALCRRDGITDKMIDDFDIEFVKIRSPHDSSEPGDDPSAPYHEQHKIASAQEKLMAKMLGVDWDEYEEVIARLLRERAESGIDD